MEPSNAPEWPTNPLELARIAADAQAAEADRRRALLDLAPLIQAVAEQVAAGFHGQVRQDLLDEALSHVG